MYCIVIWLTAFWTLNPNPSSINKSMESKGKVGIESAIQQLSESGRPYLEYFSHGTMRVGLYAPDGTDHQQPHEQDELYVIAEGSGKFYADGETFDFVKGDVLFVAAHKEHRFLDFSENFKAWVFFYGPEGGEAED